MLDQNNFILPLRNGVDIPSKPPLFHWLAAFLSKLFDSRAELLLRAPTAVAAALLLSAFFVFAGRRLTRPAALSASLILATSLDFVRAAAVTRVDMTFACWVTLGTWCLFELVEAYHKNRRTDWPLLLIASVALSLAVLSKGPAGLALPWVVAGLYTLIRLPFRQIPWLAVICSVGLSAAIASFWYVAAYRQGGQAFLDVHLMRENVARVVGMKDYETGHKGNPLELPPMLLIGLFPWSIFIVPVIARLYRKRREMFSGEAPAELFAAIWALFYLIFFALVSSKRNVYLLPSFSAWAYLLGAELTALADRSAAGRRFANALFMAFLTIVGIAAVLVAASFVYPVLSIATAHLKTAELKVAEVALSGLQLALPFLVLALALAGAARKYYVRDQFFGTAIYLAFAVILLSASAQLFVLRRVAYFESPESFMTSVNASLPRGLPLYQFDDNYYAANYYADRDVIQIDKLPELTDQPYGFMIAAESTLPQARSVLGQLETLVESSTLNVYGKDRFVFVRFRGTN